MFCVDIFTILDGFVDHFKTFNTCSCCYVRCPSDPFHYKGNICSFILFHRLFQLFWSNNLNFFINKSVFYFQTNFLDSAWQIFHHNSVVLWHYVPEFLIFGEKYRIMAWDRYINITFCYYGVDRCRIMSNTNCSKVPNDVSVADIVAIRKNTWPERWYS